MTVGTNQFDASYWDKFYAQKRNGGISPPSQFAAFVQGEINKADLLIDVGCGSGRDTFFFAERVNRVVGIDLSSSAVQVCKETAAEAGMSNVEFIQGSIEDNGVGERLESIARDSVQTVVYARFFLHAAALGVEAALLDISSRVCKKNGLIAVEFRTTKDEQLQKREAPHFRRYIDPLEFAFHARSKGFASEYFVEGFGLAKYMTEDAHVARFLLRPITE